MPIGFEMLIVNEMHLTYTMVLSNEPYIFPFDSISQQCRFQPFNSGENSQSVLMRLDGVNLIIGQSIFLYRIRPYKNDLLFV